MADNDFYFSDELIDVPGSECPSTRDPGLLPRDSAFGTESPIFEESINAIRERDWKEAYEEYRPSLRPMVAKIKNQRQEGSCTANACTGSYETIACQQYGLENFIELSAISLYKRTGSSPNSGSTVNGNMREMRDTGALPTLAMRNKITTLDLDPNHTMPETGFYTRFPDGWKETAKHFRIVEYFDIRDIEGFVTALLLGFTVHYGRRGHSIYGVSLIYRGSTPYCEYANSWAPSWGDKGFGYDTISGLRSSINSYGAFAYRDVIVPPKLLSGIPVLSE